MSRLLWFAKEMRKHLRAEVEVKINFRAPPMRVRRKRIPNAARLKRGHAHHELAALDSALMDELINRALVGSFHRTEIHRRGIGGFHHRRWMRKMRGTGEKIK